MKYCKNCGKLINPSTLVCDACGTDYNEKPKCEHYYTEFRYARYPIQCSIQLLLRCEKCKEVTLLNCSENMIFDMLKNSFEV